jgi:competence CoiA-like predicted nuclease
MGRFERSIKIAFDNVSGEILEADELFKNTKQAFIIRRKFHLDEIELYCCECRQKLNVSTSKYDRLHFKHQVNAEPCVLKDGDLSPAELEEFTRILKTKETQRHKDLKNKIGERLSKMPRVDSSSICIDNRFIIREGDKRRPDVYCTYEGRELAFEIQLSQLSLRYILNRHEFYQKHGIYLIWILDNFDLHRQSQLERDIKYLTKYENFFKLDEDVEEFKLSCEYKFPFVTDDNKLLTKWLTKSVGLDQLKFDEIEYQAYYYNFDDNKAKQEAFQKINAEALREAEGKKFEKLKEEERLRQEKRREDQLREAAEIKLRNMRDNAYALIRWIKQLKDKKSQVFNSVVDSIDGLTTKELAYFNSQLKLDNPDKNNNPAIHRWISSAEAADIPFLAFMLTTNKINLNVNLRSGEGLTVLQHLYQDSAKPIARGYLMRLILKRGYFITQEDEAFFAKLEKSPDNESTLLTFKAAASLDDKSHVDWIFDHSKLICILESVRQNRMIGFAYAPSNWTAFANNAIQYYGPYWEYIELAFKFYGLWDKLIQSDKKGTFHKKLETLYGDFPQQNVEFDQVIRKLYPEILTQKESETLDRLRRLISQIE